MSDRALLWRLVQGRHTATALVRTTPYGRELLVLLDDVELVAERERPGLTLNQIAADVRADFEARGFTPAE